MINSLEIFSGAGGLAKGIEMASARQHAIEECIAYSCNNNRSNY